MSKAREIAERYCDRHPEHTDCHICSLCVDDLTADIEAALADARREALEKAAKLCEGLCLGTGLPTRATRTAKAAWKRAAKEIRAMIDKEASDD